MSGSSDSQDCPRCLGKDTLMTYTEYKPMDYFSGECVRCGFIYYTKYAKSKDVDTDDYDGDTLKEINRKLTKEEKNNMKEFDKDYGIKEE
jgi:Zn ribbon nucleic-acid-binding protein